MHPALIYSAFSLNGRLSLAGDKSISHRSVFIGAISHGKTQVRNFLFSDDSFATIGVFRKMGIRITIDKAKRRVDIFGKGITGLSMPASVLYIKESGTTIRLLAGLLAGQNFSSVLTAGKTLSQRPMRRITEPLRMMGAEIKSKIKNIKSKIEEYSPLKIKGGNLKGITYKMPIASAQVKSALLLAGLYAEGKTKIIEPIKTRDHTERMLELFGVRIKVTGLEISIAKSPLVSPGRIDIPGDISSAAFFIVLALLLPRANLVIQNVGVNPTRIGIIKAFKKMGAKITVSKCRTCLPARQGVKVLKYEPVADITVKNSRLKRVTIKAKDVPSMIDELPVFMVAASLAKGKTVIEGAGELRVKETDRINSILSNLKNMGADISLKKKENAEYIEITGVDRLKGACLKSFGDHRTAMSMIVAALVAEGKSSLDDISCIDKSFPEFISLIRRLLGKRSIRRQDFT